MKKLNIYTLLMLLAAFTFGCHEELPELDRLIAPSDLNLNVNVSEDGSGQVNFQASAKDAMVYHYYLGIDDNESPVISPDGSFTYAYKASGTYFPRVLAFGAGGQSSSTAAEIEVNVVFEPPTELVTELTNNSSRTWVWHKSVPGHLGVGPEFYDDGSVGDAPIWYTAAPFEKESAGCLYSDEITFTQNANGAVSMQLTNNGVTYFHIDEAADALGVARPASDECYEYAVPETNLVSFFESDNGIPGSTDVGMELSGGGFMSYYLNSSVYEIMSIEDGVMTVRVVQDVDGFKLAWYQTFIATDAQDDEGDNNASYELVWSDEFDTEGAPDAAIWTYDLGTGTNGWGNNESQYYTDRAENIKVENGLLKITALRENFSGSQFTSARIKTENNFEFTYGKVEVRAKLPEGVGTWPAIWMLGANFDQVSWPACGEIDIMEHVGRDQDQILASLHSPSSFGATQNSGKTTVSGVSNEFHVYAVEWTEESITFSVDDQAFYSYNPEVKNNDTWPFDKDFFLILNVAMGGTLGGEIDGNFTESTMEVDYVKVYQQQ